MSLEIVAARDINHAFDILSIKSIKNEFVLEPNEIGNFLYDFRESFSGNLSETMNVITNLIRTGKLISEQTKLLQSSIFRTPS